MTISRLLPGEDAEDLLALAREIADAELAPRAAEYEAAARFPREVLDTLGKSGLLGLPFPERFGGGAQPYEVYAQVLEILASRWLSVAESVNVHTLACHAVATHGTDAQRERFLPAMLEGRALGANCMSEPHAGSDVAAMSARAVRDGDVYVVDGTKAWITHAGVADLYLVYCRTGGAGARGISCLLADAATPGILPQRPEKKMGVSSSPTAQVVLSGARIPADRLLGREGRGFLVAMDAVGCGRIGIAACAVGLAQAALDYAVAYAKTREQFGQPVIMFQGVGFLLAELAAQISAARALTVYAARLRDASQPYTVEAAKAKLFATDVAMRVTTEAVQVLGGYGYVTDHPVERWMREAKLLQIVEGTNQIQRLVISQAL
jgi:alkylation response protein AidB-like acyl-CoA dehydrogenase